MCVDDNIFVFQMAQELDIIEKDPNYVNPYKINQVCVSIQY